jgi:uncharacterized GH25 family protein
LRGGRAGLLAAALACLPAAAGAHDFWIEPSSFRPALGSELAVSLRVGQDFRGDPVPRNPNLVQRFVLVSGAGEKPVGGFPGADPAGLVQIDQPGILWIAYRSGRTPVTLEAEKFEKYLADEGLDGILKIRKERSENAKPGREVFSRSVKSMLVAGGAPGAGKGFDLVLGLTLELVPEKNPSQLGPDGTLPLRLLYEGKPLEGALIVAMNQAEPDKKVTARTSRRGSAVLRLPRKGVWLIKAVHMIPAPAGVDADWESIWASLTFEAP